jgi:hypothetical protein
VQDRLGKLRRYRLQRGGLSRMGEMKQLTLATAGFERYAKTTRRAAFSGRDARRSRGDLMS